MRPATTSAPGLTSAVQCNFWQSAEGWLSSRIDSFAAPSGNADNLRGTAVPDVKVIPYCGREAFANRVAKVQFVARSAKKPRECALMRENPASLGARSRAGPAPKTNLQARSCSAALPVRGSSKPSQHSIKRSKTFSRAANHPRPGRIHLVQYRKIRQRRPKSSKCDSPARLWTSTSATIWLSPDRSL